MIYEPIQMVQAAPYELPVPRGSEFRVPFSQYTGIVAELELPKLL